MNYNRETLQISYNQRSSSTYQFARPLFLEGIERESKKKMRKKEEEEEEANNLLSSVKRMNNQPSAN